MMEESEAYFEDLIISYLTGEITDEDKSKLLVWLNESNGNLKRYHRLNELWRTYASSESLSKYDKDRAFELFKARVAAQKARKIKRIHSAFRYAASFALFLSLTFLAFKFGQRNVKSAFADIVVEAPNGSCVKTKLPDGSLVWLNAGSKMRYSQGFGVGDRDVNLEGEGYFEVEKNPELPFNVVSDNLKVTVLGTKFNFCDYADDQYSLVALNEGKVTFRKADASCDYTLAPDRRVILDKSTGGMLIEKCDAKDAMQWVEGQLVFNGESFELMARKLERKYNVNIEIAQDSIKRLRFYGVFNANEQDIASVLEDLSSTQKIHYTLDKNGIEIY